MQPSFQEQWTDSLLYDCRLALPVYHMSTPGLPLPGESELGWSFHPGGRSRFSENYLEAIDLLEYSDEDRNTI